MFTIENEQLKVEVDKKGAELQSIFSKEHSLEYMWNADPAFWNKRSPVLFPIVGALKDSTYHYQNESFSLPRHGFAREMNFSVQEQTEDAIVFLLESNEETRENYPFEFQFFIKYLLLDAELSVTYGVWNKGHEEMFFSVGGHPAFKVPLVEGTTYEDYRLQFEKNETLGRWQISPDGLIENHQVPLLQDSNTIALKKELFKDDAIVLKHLRSDSVKLMSAKTSHGIDFNFNGFPYLGIWASPGADFVCIEPWCGIADSVDTQQDLTKKEGIRQLSPGELFEVSWKANFF
ncbi:MAG TPA: aldose 1-epimerase family protein [Chitinophagaceae bacterium]|nr:aldose 1-epimerase family protein [Chitinophagaceae bacterium]